MQMTNPITRHITTQQSARERENNAYIGNVSAYCQTYSPNNPEQMLKVLQYLVVSKIILTFAT